jgi:hypothetical protein
MMLNGQEVPWTVSNQAQAVVQNMGTVGNAVINYGKSVVNNVKEDGSLAYQGTAVATSGQTTIPQKIAGAAVAVAAVTDVATSVIPESSVESTVGKTIARDAEKSVGAASARTIAEDTGKLHQPGYLPDDANVVRGGQNKPENFTNGSGVTTDANGNVQNVSVNSAPGKPVEALTTGIPHPTIGTTTVGEVRAAGGDVIPKPTPRNPDHALMGGLPAESASKIMEVVPKPPPPPSG